MRNTDFDPAWQAMAIAAAGGHHTLLIGPPASAKTFFAENLAKLLPEPSGQDAARIAALRAASGSSYYPLAPGLEVPWSAPHHSTTMNSLMGTAMRPGAASLAHLGVLFIDDAPEWKASVLRELIHPMADGEIRRRRADASITRPARFQLVMAATECPCGPRYPDAHSCDEFRRGRYLHWIPTELTHACDLRLALKFPTESKFTATDDVTQARREAVANARAAAAERWSEAGLTSHLTRDIPSYMLRQPRWRLASDTTRLIDALLNAEVINQAGYDRVLALAWSLADLEGHTIPQQQHIERILGLGMIGLGQDLYA